MVRVSMCVYVQLSKLSGIVLKKKQTKDNIKAKGAHAVAGMV